MRLTTLMLSMGGDSRNRVGDVRSERKMRNIMKKYGGKQREKSEKTRPREDDRQKPLATYPLYIYLRILYL